MKKLTAVFLLLAAALVLGACGGTPGAAAPSGPVPAVSAPAAPASAPRNPWYDGDGGKGVSLAILAPQGKGLAADQEYLPALVQGEMVSNFSGYSAIAVLDRVNLDRVIGETLSGYYEDDAEGVIRLGHMTNTDYVMTGALTKTSSGYALQMQIAATADGITKASYSAACTVAELDNAAGARRASAELLRKMGVELTGRAEEELAGAAEEDAVNARTALARGITARRSGTVVQALSYYYEAAKFDPSLAEAASRASVLSADIQGGNIGENIRNDIQRRAAWVRTLEEAAAFFKNHPPFEILYDPALTQGNVDYDRETVSLSFGAKMIGATGFRVIRDLDQGLERTGRSREWNIGVGSVYGAIPARYDFTAVLINEGGETIGRAAGRFDTSGWVYGSGYDFHHRDPVRGLDYGFSHQDTTVTFTGVDASKITGGLTVSITGINGMDAKTAGERGYMRISAENFADLDRVFSFRWSFEGLEIVRCDATSIPKAVVIPSKIAGRPVTSIGDGAFTLCDLTGVTIPGSIASIGEGAFTVANDRLASVTIPAGVELKSPAFPYSFDDYYNAGGRKAGTYRYDERSKKWTMR